MKRKTRKTVTAEQFAIIQIISKWLLENCNAIQSPSQATGWAQLIVSDSRYDKRSSWDLRISGESIQLPPVEEIS